MRAAFLLLLATLPALSGCNAIVPPSSEVHLIVANIRPEPVVVDVWVDGEYLGNVSLDRDGPIAPHKEVWSGTRRADAIQVRASTGPQDVEETVVPLPADTWIVVTVERGGITIGGSRQAPVWD